MGEWKAANFGVGGVVEWKASGVGGVGEWKASGVGGVGERKASNLCPKPNESYPTPRSPIRPSRCP